MQRLIARLLLLFVLAGTLIPLALAETAAPAHACCVRKGVHQCHSSGSTESQQLAVRSTGCCGQDCCRAARTSQWASPQPWAKAGLVQNVTVRKIELQPSTPITGVSAFQSTRAPPKPSIA
jgi:hypothetical protein